MNLLNFREPVSTWSHLAGLLLAPAGTWLLWRRTRSQDTGKRLSLLLYGVCLALCYGASALYHGVRISSDRLGPFIRLDSVGIFALIAGTYTPVARTLMKGRWRSWTLAGVWVTTLVAIALIATGHRLTPVAGTCVYLGMGWCFVACYARITRVLSHRQLFPIVLGGVLYSVGAVLNLLGRPALWPGSFGTHDLFHLFVIGGSLAHYDFLLNVIVPYRPNPPTFPR